MGLLNQTAREYYEGADNNFNSGDENYGDYQFVSLSNLVNQFILAYVGEEKIISKAKNTDVLFHTRRAIQEFSFDLFPNEKAIEIELGPALSMILPQDYVNYVRFSWIDNSGGEHIIYPTRYTSNPKDAIAQDANFNYQFGADTLPTVAESDSSLRFKAASNTVNDELSEIDLLNLYRYGRRYGLEPEVAQGNGVFYIDQVNGKAQFSSGLAGKTISLKYISDGLATDADQKVHKFAEEAIYTYVAHAILATRANTPEYQIARFKKEAAAARRNAKLRMSNLKLGEMAQVMRNQAKWIKH